MKFEKLFPIEPLEPNSIANYMVYGCGLDVEEICRFEKYVKSDDLSLMKHICSDREMDNINKEYIDKRIRLALTFTFKESFYKALGRVWTTSDISWKDMEIEFETYNFGVYNIGLSKIAIDALTLNNVCCGEASFDYTNEYVVFKLILVSSHF